MARTTSRQRADRASSGQARCLEPVQEALLECYGGIRLASALDRHADRLRPVPVPTADAAEPDAPERTRRRSGQGHGSRVVGRGTAGSESQGEPSEDPEPPDPPAGPADDIDAEGEMPAPASGPPPRAAARIALACLDEVDPCAEFHVPVPTVHCVPRFLVAGVRRAFTCTLRAVQEASHRGNATTQDRAWTLFLLLPCPLLRRSGSEGRSELLQRLELFEAGNVERLLREARSQPLPTANCRALGKCLQLGCWRQATTLRLRPCATLPRRPPVPCQEIAAESLQVDPAHRVALTVQQVAEALRSTKHGAAPGLSGATEHYKLLLDEPSALEAFTAVVNRLARACRRRRRACPLAPHGASQAQWASRPATFSGVSCPGCWLARLLTCSTAPHAPTIPYQSATDALAAVLRDGPSMPMARSTRPRAWSSAVVRGQIRATIPESEVGDNAHCLAEAAHARRTLQDQGWSNCPTWSMLLDGARPAPPEAPGAGDWPHGWQYHTSRTFTEHSRDRVLFFFHAPFPRVSVHDPCARNRQAARAAVCQARKGNLDGCSASASSRTQPSGVPSSPVGCAGARQRPPNSVEAKARCNAQPSCPHHRRSHPERAAARSALGARRERCCARSRTRSCAFCPPSSADLRSQDDEALRARTGEFGVAPLFAPPRDVDGSPIPI